MIAHRETTIWLGDDTKTTLGEFDIHSEDDMVCIEATTEGGDDVKVFLMREIFPAVREVMDRIDRRCA